MKNKLKIIPILMITLISLCLSTSCYLIEDNFKVRDLISYINRNKEGDEQFQVAKVYDENVQKSIEISFVSVDTVIEADEIIRLVNQYLEDHPDYFLNEDYYIEITMEADEIFTTLNFLCRNSLQNYNINDKDFQDVSVVVENKLCHLIVVGTVLDHSSYFISSYSGLFSDIRVLALSRDINLDDLSAFGSMDNLEKVAMLTDQGQISEETLAQLKETYPEIEFVS